MIGKELSPVLTEIESTLIEFYGYKPNFTDAGFRSATYIFLQAVLDKMWEVQNFDKMDIKDRELMAEKCGNEISKLIKTYTDIDTHKMF
jgi:hypothetical protein